MTKANRGRIRGGKKKSTNTMTKAIGARTRGSSKGLGIPLVQLGFLAATAYCLLYSIKITSQWKSDENTNLTHHTQTVDSQHNIDIDFTYDRERWDENSPKIVILLGPHKTGSTTIQGFLMQYARLQLPVNPNTQRNSTLLKPHPKLAHTNWVWPFGLKEEFPAKWQNRQKFYCPLAAVIEEYNRSAIRAHGHPIFFQDHVDYMKDYPTAFLGYFKSLFRLAWEDGKNIVFGSEEFDGLISHLQDETAGTIGEAIHVEPQSSLRIDWLLDLLPWDDDRNENSFGAVSRLPSSRSPSLRLEDIEVQINYRTPRISHIESLWREVTNKSRLTLHDFIASEAFDGTFHVTNCLAFALQFAHKGIKTTIVNMAGVAEKEKISEIITGGLPDSSTTGGLVGVIACEILKMGGRSNSSEGLCDDQRRVRFPNYGPKNVRENLRSKDLNKEQLDQINRAYEEYDCSVWRHLQKYQAKGSLRILYPTKDLFANCNAVDGIRKDIPFSELLETVKSIARSQSNVSIAHP